MYTYISSSIALIDKKMFQTFCKKGHKCKVQASSVYQHYGEAHSSNQGPQFAVDGKTSNGANNFGFFHSGFEHYPWLAVSPTLNNFFSITL